MWKRAWSWVGLALRVKGRAVLEGDFINPLTPRTGKQVRVPAAMTGG